MKVISVSAFLLALSGVNAKVVECTPDLTRDISRRWAFCTKMAFGKDKLATIRATASFHSDYTNDVPKNV